MEKKVSDAEQRATDAEQKASHAEKSTKEQMLQKVKAWGHNTDKDWVSLIEEEFNRPFNGKCFVNNYEFEVI